MAAIIFRFQLFVYCVLHLFEIIGNGYVFVYWVKRLLISEISMICKNDLLKIVSYVLLVLS